jgi:translocation and assembly module TamB
LSAATPNPVDTPTQRWGVWGFCWRAAALIMVLSSLVVAALLFYASTDHFLNQVRQKVISVLQDATGGRVEIQSLHWTARHLSVEVNGLTIHGLEGPGELPYAHVDRIYARARILSIVDARLGLDYLEADRPSIHLIIYPDGKTNQPTPPKAQEKGSDLQVRTIFDLQANRLEVHQGLVLINQRAIPFQVAANNTGVVVTYAPATRQYLGDLTCSDLTAQKGKIAPVHSQLTMSVEAGEDAINLKSLRLTTGKSTLQASGALSHFADPQWKLTSSGTVELAELTTLNVVDGLQKGSVDLALSGQGMAARQFVVDGTAKINSVTYSIPYVLIDGLNATTHFHITPDEIALPDFVGRPRQGGTVNADVRYLHYLEPALPPAPQRSKGSKVMTRSPQPTVPVMQIRARVQRVRLSTVLYSVVERGYQDLGFDTLGDGPVYVDWTGDASDLTVAAKLSMSNPPSTAPGQLPLTGMVDAKYFQRGGRVQVYQLQAHSPATNLNVTGLLGVYPIDEPSNLSIHLVNHDLGEFDHVLKTLGLGVNGKKGISGLPIQLHGDATFDGAGTGSLVDPAFNGHLTANQFSTTIPANLTKTTLPIAGNHQGGTKVVSVPPPALFGEAPALPPATAGTTISWDQLDATGGYSSSLISLEQGMLRRGKTVIRASGQLQAHRISKRRVAFDDDATLTATAQMQDAPLTDLLAIAGQDLPVTGTVNFQAHAGGTLGSLDGSGSLTVAGGEFEGQPYHSLTAGLTLAGHDIRLEKLTLLQDGGTVRGNGTYDLKSRTFLANMDGTNFELAHFPQSKDARLSVAGAVKFDVHASGTIETPSILLGIHMRDLVLGGQPAGNLEVIAHTLGDTANFTARTSDAGAQLLLKGQTQLHGNFQTQANMVLTNLNIAPFLKAFHVESVTGNSSIGGTITMAGPLRDPKQFSGDAEIRQFAATLQGIALESSGPMRASLHEGILHLTQVHITGPDTDLSVIGTAALVDGQELSLAGNGSLNVKLAQSFDPDITSSGKVDFNVDANGTLTRPLLSGRLHLANVALALNDLPNGISKLNGNLIFDQNRLQVQDLMGTTGGGQLKFGGFLAYQQGIYGDFTAQGKDIRVRYLGISATADTTLHLQGSQANMLLSGNVQITRFIIGPNVDFASFATGPGTSVPPNPNAASSHVRLDVHIFSAPQLDFQNSYAQLAGSVDLRIRGTVAQPAILGRINITDGTANFAGTTYRLQHGEIFFTNPVMIEPIIDIDATTRVEEYDVTIGLHGNASKLTPTFRSEPPLPQADVISLLALGRTQEEQALYSQQEQSVGSDSTTNALLGGALNAAVGSRVQKLFGGGSVKIDPTYVGTVGSSSARITVSQNLARNIQVTYATNVNATAQQLIQAQIDVTSSVSLLAVRDEAGVFSVVMKVHKRFR